MAQEAGLDESSVESTDADSLVLRAIDQAVDKKDKAILYELLRSGKTSEEIISDEQLKPLFEDLHDQFSETPSFTIEAKRRIFTLEKMIDRLAASVEVPQEQAVPGKELSAWKEKNEQGDTIGEVKADWTEYDWSNEQIRRVERTIRENLKNVARISLSDDQVKSILENLVANGKKPEDVLSMITVGEITKIKTEMSESPSQRRYSGQDSQEFALRFFYEKFDIRQDYVKHFITPEEFEQSNDAEYEDHPKNIEELAWQIMRAFPNEFGFNGKFPVLKMRIARDAHGNIDTEKSRYYVDEANMARWDKQRIWSWHDENPQTPYNFFERVVELPKRLGPLNVEHMLTNESTFFTSEDGKTKYGDLANHWRLEILNTMIARNWDLEYDKIAHDEQKLPDKLREMFFSNVLTRKLLNKNEFYYIAVSPLNFQRRSEKDGMPHSDTIMGAAWLEMFLAYYNFSDFEKLQEILGADSSFFNYKSFQKGFLKHIQDLVRKKQMSTGVTSMQAFFKPETYEKIEKVFDTETGEIKDKKAFCDLLNIFDEQAVDQNLKQVVRNALKSAVAERYDFTSLEGVLDETSLNTAELRAISWMRWTGGVGRNDIGAAGFDSEAKWIQVEKYRRKMNTVERGNAAGNIKNIPQYRSMLVPFLSALSTTQYVEITDEQGRVVMKTVKNEDGSIKRDENGRPIKKPLTRRKTPLEVMEELHAIQVAQHKEKTRKEKELKNPHLSPADKEKKEKQLSRFEEISRLRYRNKAGELEFGENAERLYSANQIDRAVKLYTQLMTAVEIDFDKFTRFTYFGIKFKRAEFQKAIQDEFLKPLRYLLHTYGDLNFNMPIRASMPEYNPADPTQPKWVYKTVPLGEMMFGYEMLNRKVFWKITNGRYEMDKKTGRHVIDYNKVNGHTVELWKQWALTRFSSDLAMHRDRHGTDPQYNHTYYRDVVEAISSISGGILGDESSIKDVRVGKTFFSKDDIKWMRYTARVEGYDLDTRALLETFFMPREGQTNGVSEAVQAFFRAIAPNM